MRSWIQNSLGVAVITNKKEKRKKKKQYTLHYLQSLANNLI